MKHSILSLIALLLLSVSWPVSQSAAADSEDKAAEKSSEKSTEKGSEKAEPKHHRQGLIEQMSGQGYGMAGCGLGSILFGEAPGMVQIFASSTNAIYWNNTFAASSGTSNCDEDENSSQASLKSFIESNRLAIQDDIARGSGETLSAFYDVAGCAERDQEVVSKTLQKNYPLIFKAGSDPESVLNSIRTTLKNTSRLQQSCTNLG